MVAGEERHARISTTSGAFITNDKVMEAMNEREACKKDDAAAKAAMEEKVEHNNSKPKMRHLVQLALQCAILRKRFMENLRFCRDKRRLRAQQVEKLMKTQETMDDERVASESDEGVTV